MPAWSGFWGDGVGSSGGYSLLVDKYPNRNRIKRLVNREGFRAYTELFDTLIGAAAGNTASATHKRIAHPTDSRDLGGSRTIDTVTDISRVSTAADVTELK